MRPLALTVLLTFLLLACSDEAVGPHAEVAPEDIAESEDQASDQPLADGEITDTPIDALPTTLTLEQWGITWTFASPVVYGRFANGDYWVLGPVTVVSMTPDFDGAHHGWESNPSDIVKQGFDGRIADFDANKVPALPYVAQPGESIVKAISLAPLGEACRPCLQTAAVLTVLAEPPADAGATVFRPPYFGAAKPQYTTTALRLEALPSLAAPANAPALELMTTRFARVQLDHKTNWTGRALHPKDNLPDYGSDIAIRSAEGALRLFLDDPVASKMPLLIAYVQFGIDLNGMLRAGQRWPANGGHSEGRKLPMAFAAWILDDPEMQADVSQAATGVFGENAGVYHSEAAGVVLYGPMASSEENYWRNVVFDTGSRTLVDPYRTIDGGHRPGGSYQFCCLAQPWKANAIASLLVPELRSLWNHEDFFVYVERWVSHGAWAQPDPCAPATGECVGGDNAGSPCTSASQGELCTGEDAHCDLTVHWERDYGVAYGPDGAGGCILDTDPSDGIGRFPHLHGSGPDGGHYGSAFANALWTTYVEP